MTREEILEMQRRFEKFNRWEETLPPVERPAAEIVADVGAIWRMIPADVRVQDPDPAKSGVRKMQAVIERLRFRR
ncbi:MAG: hypothetical protein ACRD96_22415 [Bryobacteraceae bacterium]